MNETVRLSRRGVAAGLAGLALARGLPARAQEPPAWLDQKLLAAARKEGPLTVYSSTNEQEGLPLFKIFEDAAGIKFNYIRGNDASLSSRIAIETRAKQPSFDIVHMTNAHKMPQALLAQFDPPEAKHINPLARDPGRRWYGVYTVYTTPAYNTKLVSKADLTHIPYKGAGPAIVDAMAGFVPLVTDNITSLKPHIDSGRLRGIAIGSAQRSEAAPQLATFAESGYTGFEASSWWGILVPANTPPAVIARLNSELNKALDDSAVKARLLTHGATIKSGTPAQAAELMTSEIEKWAKVVKATGARVD